MVARDDEQRRAEASQESRRLLVLRTPSAVREVAARDHERRLDARDEISERLLRDRFLVRIPRAEMEIGHVEDAGVHRRSRLQ